MKNYLRKLIALLFALLLTVSVAACGVLDAQDVIDIAEVLLTDDTGEAEADGDEDYVGDAGSVVEDSSSSEEEDAPIQSEEPQDEEQADETPALDEDGTYSSKEDVALYLHLYGHLPSNFMTKSEAREKGWEGGSLEKYAPGYAIGGDKFGNNEGLLPKASGRQYYECDIDTIGASSRGAKRIVYSNDGLIYYTEDHYTTFELLYGEE